MDENTKEIVESSEKEDKKGPGRKFFAFIVWVVIVIAAFVLAGIGKVSESILTDTLRDLFYVSVVYITGNVVQKGAFAISDVFKNKEEKEGEK